MRVSSSTTSTCGEWSPSGFAGACLSVGAVAGSVMAVTSSSRQNRRSAVQCVDAAASDELDHMGAVALGDHAGEKAPNHVARLLPALGERLGDAGALDAGQLA